MFTPRPMMSLLRRHRCLVWRSSVASPDILQTEDVKPFKDIPGPKGRFALPKLGPLFYVKPFGEYTSENIYKLFDKLHKEHGRIFCMELLGKTVFTADPDTIQVAYRNEGKYPNRGPIVGMNDYYAEKNKRQKGMASLNGEKWHRLRSASQAYMLKSNSASIYIDAQVGVARDLITRMSSMSYTPAQFREELFKFATESIGVVCFNKRLGFMDTDNKPITPDMEDYLEALKMYFELLLQDVGPPIYKIFPTKLYKRFEKHADDMYGFGQKQINETVTKVGRQMKDGTFDPEEPNLILQLQSNPKTTPETVNAILLDLLTAGTDSTAKNTENMLLVLGLNQDKQEKLYEEIVRVVGPKDCEMQEQHMRQMEYFRACLKESFRINFPIGMGAIRLMPKDVVLDGYLVPKGTVVVMNSRHVCNNPEYFESPREYIPERWLRDHVTLKREKEIPAFGLLPFGVGSRNCLGRRFAEQELWLGVVKIIQNFKVSVSEEDKNYEMIYTSFGQANTPVKFTFTPR